MEIPKQIKEGKVKNHVKNPCGKSGTSVTVKMEPQKRNGSQKTEKKLNNLAIGHKFTPRRRHSNAVHKIVEVHHHVNSGVGKESHCLETLLELHP